MFDQVWRRDISNR